MKKYGQLCNRVVIATLIMLVVESGYTGDSKDEKPFGIAKRIPWTTSRITGSPEPPPPYRVERAFGNLQFKQPVILTNAPATDRLFVVEVAGRVLSFPNDQNGQQADLAIDLSKEIEGMSRVYGLAFHPEFEENRYCYICYVTKEKLDDGTRVSRFRVSKQDPPQIDPASEEVIITWLSGGHNGGCMKFASDGCLYITTGDGSGPFPADIHDTGQRIDDLLSAVLRIDVDHPDGDRLYSIPSDNPFVAVEAARGEVWSYGYRNPWKISFDAKTNSLWVGDVGWEMWEMIYRVRRGSNFGWSIVEASQSVHPERQRGPNPIEPPTIAHSHTESRSITGGLVYRGQRLPKLYGSYVYGDYVTGKIWGATFDDEKVTKVTELVDAPLQIIGFGADNANEMYFMNYADDGAIWRLVPNDAKPTNRKFPRKLSETGLFASVRDHKLAPGVIPYNVIAEPWADHAMSQRFVAIPGTGQLGINDSSNVQIGYIKGEWSFPNDSVLAKTISLEMKAGVSDSLRHLETQILHFNKDAWKAYNYIWNDDQTDAELAGILGSDRTFTVVDSKAPGGKRQQTWHFASRTECILCHTTRAGTVHGFKPEQLDRDRNYGAITDNQLRTLGHIGLFAEPPDEKDKRLIDPRDDSADLNDRARAYLHVNCAHCHRRGGGGTAAMDIQYHLSIKQTNLLNARPTQGTFGIHAAQVFAPGDPYRSVMLYRMSKLGRGRMPHFGSNIVDVRGTRLIHDWIARFDDDVTEPKTDLAAALIRAKETTLVDRLQKSKDADDGIGKAVDELLSSTRGAIVLLQALDSMNYTVKSAAIAKATAHADVQIRDLFERFIPAEQRVKRLGAVIRPEQILSLKGDIERGNELFSKSAGVACRNCHKIDKVGKKVGPDLSHIGKKYNRQQLLESILEPSKKIEEKFRTYLIETAAGRVHSGILEKRTADEVVLRDATNKQLTFDRDDIEQILPQAKSIMPELLIRDMTAQEVADLLELLQSLK